MSALGMQGARVVLLDRLRDNLSAELEVLAIAAGLPVDGLEGLYPQLFAPSERRRLENDEWPAVMAVGQASTGRGHKRDFDANTSMVTVSRAYKVRLFVSVRDDGYDATSIARDRLMHAVWFGLFRRPKLGEGVRVDVETWDESYSSIDSLDGRHIAGGFLEVTVISDEGVTQLPTPPADPEVDSILIRAEAMSRGQTE